MLTNVFCKYMYLYLRFKKHPSVIKKQFVCMFVIGRLLMVIYLGLLVNVAQNTKPTFLNDC